MVGGHYELSVMLQIQLRASCFTYAERLCGWRGSMLYALNRKKQLRRRQKTDWTAEGRDARF